MKIDNATATIKITDQSVKPAWEPFKSAITFHLTSGYNVANNLETIGEALHFAGSVEVSTTPSEFATWHFGFLQLQKVSFFGAFFAGAVRSNGQVVMLFHKSPKLKSLMHLDSDTAFAPFTSSFKGTLSGGKVTNFGGDHPASRMRQNVVNLTNNARNHLFHLVDDRTFVTSFSARSPSGTFEHLAHVRWSVRYDVMFRWKGGKPQEVRQSSRYSMGTVTLGPPSDKAERALLDAPKGPFANDEFRAAIFDTVAHGKPPARTDDKERRFVNLPNNFFT